MLSPINNLSTPPPPANLVSAIWTAYWTYAGTTHFAQANSTGPVVTYRDGTCDGSFHTKSTITGAFIPGKNGRIILNIPRADVGNPPNEDGKPDGVSAHDGGSGKDFHSTSVTVVVRDTTNGTLMLVGQGLENNLPVEFTAVFVKSAEYAIGYPSLSLSDGTGFSGKLLNGTVEL